MYNWDRPHSRRRDNSSGLFSIRFGNSLKPRTNKPIFSGVLASGVPVTRSIAELEAEAVSYVVCKHANLDVEVRASRYIALWEGDSKNLKASLGRIADTARSMIDDLDKAAGRKAVA